MSNTKQAFWVLLGSLSAFVFSIVSSMVLSRYMNKLDYGTFRQILYVYGSLVVVFSLGLPKTYSFFLPRLPIEEAKSAIGKINNLLLGSGILMSLVLFFGAETIASLLNNSKLITPLKYFSMVPVFLLPTIGLEGVLASFKKTQLLAAYNIVTKLVMLACVVLPVVLWNGGVESAVIGFTIASFFAFLLALFLKTQPVRNVTSKVTQLKYKEIFNYSTPLLFASLWGIVILSSDQFFISRYFGTEVFAEFANGSLQLPFVGMIVAATTIVLAPIYSKKAFADSPDSKQEIIQLWNSVFSKTIKLTYPLIAFFFCFSDTVMVALYGQAYINSGDYFKVKLIVDFFTLITYGPLIVSIGGNKYYYRVHMYIALFLISTQWLSVHLINLPIAIVWISVTFQIIKTFALLVFIAKYFELKLYQIFPWSVIARVLPSFAILYGIQYVLDQRVQSIEPMLLLTIYGGLYLIIFLVWAYISKLDYLSIIKPLLKRNSI